MAGLLTDYLRGAAGKHFALGRFDCCLYLADWIVLARGIDPAGRYRGRYRGLDDVPELAAGGLLKLLAGLARDAGLKATRRPSPGDVALVSISGGPITGAIATARGFTVLAEGGGLSCASRGVRIVRAWKI